jgi:hypothetical protein
MTEKQLKAYCDNMICVLVAVKHGAKIQRCGRTTDGKWEDFDLKKFIKSGPMKYRVKPVKRL